MRLRIIAGTLGGRFFDTPANNDAKTHPMSESLRGALFNIVGDLTGQTVLDAFAGSGALSFEAVSRGADSVIAIEKDKRAQETIVANLRLLEIDTRIKLIKASCRAWSETSQNMPFDVILCDPPYHDLQLSTVALLTRHLKQGGVMILSHSGRESAPTVNGVVVVDKRIYGDAALAFYRKEAA